MTEIKVGDIVGATKNITWSDLEILTVPDTVVVPQFTIGEVTAVSEFPWGDALIEVEFLGTDSEFWFRTEHIEVLND